MITTYTFDPTWGLLDPSPFGTKLLAYLRLAGIPHNSVSGFDYVRKAPKGKMPYIKTDNGEMLGDSSLIIQHLKQTHGDTLNAGLTDTQHATGHALAKMLDENTYWYIVHCRWADEDNWQQITRPAFFGKMPAWQNALIAPLLRRGVKKSLHAQGLGRHSADELTAIARADYQCLTTLLGDQPFLFGDQPCEYDVWAYAFTSAITNTPHNTPLRDMIHNSALAGYVERFETLIGFTPDDQSA